jgi:hypothetical protein
MICKFPSFPIFLIFCGGGSASILVPAHGIASELYLVGIVEQAVTDGTGQGRVTNVGMPVTDGTLAGNGGR